MLLRVFRSLYHTLWYVVAALILLSAIGVTLARLSLPYIDNFRPDIEIWLGDYLGQPVKIGNIEADWQGWTPFLTLYQISIFNKSGTDEITDFKSAVISFDPVSSLMQKRLIPSRLQINDPLLTVIKQTDGSITITRETGNLSFDDQIQSKTAFTKWLLQQKQVAIEGARLKLVNPADNRETVELSNVALTFKNIIGRTQISGSADLPKSFGESINFAFDIFGDITTPSWSGELYLEASAVYPTELMRYLGREQKTLTLSSSPMNIALWSTWKDARLNQAEGQLSTESIRLITTAREQTFHGIAATFAASRNQQDEFYLALEIDDFLTPTGVSPAHSIRLQKTQVRKDEPQYTINIDHLRLDDISMLFEAAPELADGYSTPETLKLKGKLTETRIIYNPDLPGRKQFYIDSDFHELSIVNETDNARIDGLQGHIRGNTDEGTLVVTSSSLDLQLPELFSNPVNFYEIHGALDWHYENDAWEISTNQLSAHTLHFTSSMHGKLNLSADGTSNFADLSVAIKDANIEDINHYLPLSLPEAVSEWLNNALLAGELNSLDILLRGQPHAFPFRNNEGRFQALATVNNATLDYNPAWTPVDALAAEIQINQEQLSVKAESGQILSSQIIDATATIANLGVDKPLLEINSTINGSLDDVVVFINNSPLAEITTFGEITQHKLEGAMKVDLDLDLPLYEEEPIKIKGNMQLFNASFDPVTNDIKLDNINGNIHFNQDNFNTENIKAHYAGHDVGLEINSTDEDLPVIRLNGSADGAFLSTQLTRFFPALESLEDEIKSRVSGTTDWLAELNTNQNSDGVLERSLIIKSSLSGLSIDLPTPFGKNTASNPLSVSLPLTASAGRRIDINYGDIFSSIIELNEAGPNKLRSAILSFGSPASLQDKQGIIISGTIDQLSLSEWFNLINTPGVSMDSSLLNDMKFDVVANSLIFFDQTFENVKFNLFKQQADWKINLEGSQINGNITVPETTFTKPLRATFDKFYITEHKKTEKKITIKPEDIPSLRIRVKDFRYEDSNLGEMILNTSTLPAGMSIDEMTFSQPEMTISGQGRWQIINDNERCDFTFDLHADYLDVMLRTFNYSAAPVKDGITTLSLNARWDGSPADFSLANIDGTLSMDIEKGQFLDIEPTAGRFFGLLSLQTLPRRLSLDFRDLFGKGLTFDRIAGNFTIQSGNAFTNDLTMTGPSANINVTGRTGLIAEDYDQLVTVTPQFADSLPVASALFGPIGVGVGAVLFLAGEMFNSIPEQIDKLLRYQYTINGSWNDPVIKKVQGKSSEQININIEE